MDPPWPIQLKNSRNSADAGARASIFTATLSVVALSISGLSFYRSYIYTKQQLEITVTELSYVTNQGELYMTVAFSNGGNRDAAVLRIEPALWSRPEGKPAPEWVPLADRVGPNIPIVSPKTPLVIRAGGVEVLTLSTRLNATEAERARMPSQDGAFLGVRVATMNSDGNLYLLEQPVARLLIDRKGQNPESRSGNSPDAQWLHRPSERAARRPAAAEQEDAFRVRPTSISRYERRHNDSEGGMMSDDDTGLDSADEPTRTRNPAPVAGVCGGNRLGSSLVRPGLDAQGATDRPGGPAPAAISARCRAAIRRAHADDRRHRSDLGRRTPCPPREGAPPDARSPARAVGPGAGSSLFYFTGVRWGLSERPFIVVIPSNGELSWICPAFEEAARPRADQVVWHRRAHVGGGRQSVPSASRKCSRIGACRLDASG